MRKRGYTVRFRLFVVTVSVVLLGGLVGPTSPSVSAAPGADQWEFSGTLSGPVRSTGDATITLSGTAQVSDGLFALAAADPSSGGCPVSDIQAKPRLRNVASGTVVDFTTGGLAIPVIDDTGVNAFSGEALAAPATYELVLSFRCTSAGSWFGNVSSTPAKSVAIAFVSNTSYLTLACLATSPPIACTSNQLQYTSVPSGTAITFAGIIRRTWSDGLVADEPVTGSQSLKYTTIGSSSWFGTVSSSCAHTETVTLSYQYRCEAGGNNFSTAPITVMSSSTDYVLGAPQVSPRFAVKGATVTVSGAVSLRYSDGSLWPASNRTLYSVQFKSVRASTWSTVVSAEFLETNGAYRATFPMTGTGKVRVVVGGDTYSPEVDLTELVPSDTYQIGSLTLPSEVPPRQNLTVSTTVKALWSDNAYRDAPDGTKVSVEFAPSFDPTSQESLLWRPVSETSVLSGVASAVVTPQASGFWRVKVGSSVSNSVYVAVTGSAPLSVTATMTAAAGEQPFVNTTSTYQVQASLTGYVGTETMTLFVDLGAGYTRVGSFDSLNALTAQPRVKAGSTSGLVAPSFEVRDPRGSVVATTTGAEIFIDSVKSYNIATVVPERKIREGSPGRVTATISGLTEAGVRVAVPWSGQVRIQRLSGRNWVTVSTLSNVRGTRASFRISSVTDSQYRLFWAPESVAGEPFTFNVITRTGTLRFNDPKAARTSIEAGRSTKLSITLFAEYSDSKYYRAPSDVRVSVQSYTGSSWKTVRTVKSRNGTVSVSVKPSSTRAYRFVAGSSTVSGSLTITVVPAKPKSLVVDWPERYRVNVGARFSVYVRTTTGGVWSGTTPMQLQYRFYRNDPWRTLNSYTYQGRRISMEWGPGTYQQVQFRVLAPSLGFASYQAYVVG